MLFNIVLTRHPCLSIFQVSLTIIQLYNLDLPMLNIKIFYIYSIIYKHFDRNLDPCIGIYVVVLGQLGQSRHLAVYESLVTIFFPFVVHYLTLNKTAPGPASHDWMISSTPGPNKWPLNLLLGGFSMSCFVRLVMKYQIVTHYLMIISFTPTRNVCAYSRL